MRRVVVAFVLAAAAATRAAAEPVEHVFQRASAKHVLDSVDVAAADLQLGLRTMTFDLLDLRLEVRRGHAKLRLGGEISDAVELRLDGHVAWRDGGARFSTRLAVGLGGEKLSVKIPDFYLAPCNVNGVSGLELRVPVLEGKW
jgi:hypothetical protein